MIAFKDACFGFFEKWSQIRGRGQAGATRRLTALLTAALLIGPLS
ncbi:hypothetical protein MNBD_ALPHA12-316 [hydrothermal vent metagenome]|uniref:Uncharacterized protein n=1 Tax=hydrothermal vent metagenome TaxID=652676 RepID=A0A3B0UDZ8_9ZZZZ